jgi:hypothetical protein
MCVRTDQNQVKHSVCVKKPAAKIEDTGTATP